MDPAACIGCEPNVGRDPFLDQLYLLTNTRIT